eukprot:TRINITY_DN7901_c0_g2_i1.p1 TRINITY_DN7901_c0_g2~~TRINITY_DN7901_c0_g2_i1.p1  ORF type:complete len:388 (-),score=76.19 TRINITY_DN7901_c0_g2_i1:322-1485(-)
MEDLEPIPFNRPYYSGQETINVQRLLESKSGLSGNGAYTKECHSFLSSLIGDAHILLTHSGTAALEMCAILCDLHAGDEVILPSYTFVSSANAFVLRGAVPVFVDLDLDRGGVSVEAISLAITPQTRAICVVHYAGIACDMDAIMSIARQHNLLVIEDAAHAIFGTYKGRMLGSIGDFAAFSFHESKNIQCGEGGALVVNTVSYRARADIVWEKGTNRRQFLDGLTPKYSWVDIGSSFLPSEITAAFLYAQLQSGRLITDARVAIWKQYHDALRPLHDARRIYLPTPPIDAGHCAHIFFFYTNTQQQLHSLVAEAKQRRITLLQHYVPLHSAPHGIRVGRVSGQMTNTDYAAAHLVRLPLWYGLSQAQIDRVIKVVYDVLAVEDGSL